MGRNKQDKVVDISGKNRGPEVSDSKPFYSSKFAVGKESEGLKKSIVPATKSPRVSAAATHADGQVTGVSFFDSNPLLPLSHVT